MGKHITLGNRFWSKVIKTRACWIWNAYTSKGYGRFHFNKKVRPAHRLAYQEIVGEIPHNLVIDHKCRTPACVNPGHMQLVTRGENVLLGFGASGTNKRKTHCPRNHSYTTIKKDGSRICNICTNEKQNARYQKNKVQVNKRRRELYKSKTALAQVEKG